MAVLELDGLTKRFGDVTAVDDLSLSVREGEVFGFLGPNGAGKSTTINLVLDFLKPTAGSVSVFGYDVHERGVPVRRRTGMLLEGYGVYEHLTGREHVEHAVATKDAHDDPDELLARVGLDADRASRPAGEYSKGMAQRLALAVALVGEPDLLVLDEPSTGLDPNGARRLREIVREEVDRGATVFLSSHVLEEVEAVCSRVAILLDGRLVVDGGIDELRAELGATDRLAVTAERPVDGVAGALRRIDGVVGATASGRRVEVVCGGGETKLRVLNRVADAAGLVDFRTEEPSLGEVFSRYTDDDTDGRAGGRARAARTAPGEGST